MSRAARSGAVACGVIAVFLAGCVVPARAPGSLSDLKREIRAYVEQGAYQRELVAVAGRAEAWITARAGRGGERLTVVFDLDETLLSNWPHLAAMDFGYVKDEWHRWVAAGEAPAIEPVCAVFRTTRRLGVEVVILTGRHERDLAGTEKNLQAIGCADYQRLIFAPDGDTRTSAEYKTAVRRRLSAEGRSIIANVGDQESDLSGGYAERTFKLPNVFYALP